MPFDHLETDHSETRSRDKWDLTNISPTVFGKTYTFA